MEHEEPLEGGNASRAVVRMGGMVRKPWTSTTPTVHTLLRAVAAAGIDAPVPLGRDEQGRQILEHVPGTLALEAPPLTQDELARVGAMIRAIHDACRRFRPAEEPGWDPLLPAPDGEADVICHGDLTPWNLAIGERWVFIDGDAATPTGALASLRSSVAPCS